jgi:hypothetical protein
MTDYASRCAFPADQGGVKLTAVLKRNYEGRPAGPTWKMHALDLISWIVENPLGGGVDIVHVR